MRPRGTVFVIAAAIAATSRPDAAQTPPQAPPNPLVLEVGLHLYQGDQPARSGASNGAQSARAGMLDFTGYIWTSPTLCFYVASDKPPAATSAGTPANGKSTDVPSIAWRVSGKVLDRSGDDFHVQLEWQRLWDHSKPVGAAPTETRIVTIRPGDRIGLDGIAPETSSPCRMTAARLEAAIVTETDARRAGGFDHQDPPEGQVVISFMTRSGSTVPAGGRPTTIAEALGSGPVLGRPVAGASYHAELWLVHALPDGQERAQLQPLQLATDASKFAFPAVAINTRAGSVSVAISGLLQPVVLDDGGVGLRFLIERRLSGAVNGIGSSNKTISLPSASEVVAIEMPALSSAPADPLAGHDFSLRLRIAPGKG